jgi:hypothetical protein
MRSQALEEGVSRQSVARVSRQKGSRRVYCWPEGMRVRGAFPRLLRCAVGFRNGSISVAELRGRGDRSPPRNRPPWPWPRPRAGSPPPPSFQCLYRRRPFLGRGRGSHWSALVDDHPAIIACIVAPDYLLTKDVSWIVTGFVIQGVFGGRCGTSRPPLITTT